MHLGTSMLHSFQIRIDGHDPSVEHDRRAIHRSLMRIGILYDSFVRPSVCPSVCPFACLSVRLSVRQPISSPAMVNSASSVANRLNAAKNNRYLKSEFRMLSLPIGLRLKPRARRPLAGWNGHRFVGTVSKARVEPRPESPYSRTRDAFNNDRPTVTVARHGIPPVVVNATIAFANRPGSSAPPIGPRCEHHLSRMPMVGRVTGGQSKNDGRVASAGSKVHRVPR
ncbi:unnamed protein product [Soboliphyme baturini]|uniref:Transposase n=1 Tax=Soboliphyme baturini TaxID=241478 RepID=A0A183J1C5_9BILA|nr:unnamed protein product [Soboliphyme baturini]